MPALRKSARERDARSQHYRSSTTPLASPTNTPSDLSQEKKQRSITEWTEPQPQTLAPSFEEHGFARHGVLENMAPLGVPPKAKDKQRARNLDVATPRHSLLIKGSALLGDEPVSTPEMTPAPELEPDDDDERPDDDEAPAELPAFVEEADDGDYEPAKMKKKARLSKTPVRGKTPVQKTPVSAKSPLKNRRTKSLSVPASPAVAPADVIAQRLLIAVNEAVSRANKSDQRHIGVAIKCMFEESKTNQDIADAMDAIIKQNPTTDQWSTFRICIKRIKKEQKVRAKLHKQDRYSKRAANVPRARTNHQSSPRASSEVAPDDSVSAVHDLHYQRSSSNVGHVLAATNDSHNRLPSSIDRNSALNPPHPFSTAPTLPAADSSAESTPRVPSKSPRKRPAMNGTLASDLAIYVDGGLSTAIPTPAARTPDTGGSDSELSDVNEEIVQKGPPELPQVNGNKSITHAAAGVPKKGKNKNTAQARAAKKLKGNVGKLFGKHASKQHPLTAEQIADEARIRALRAAMLDEQPIRRFDDTRLPMSNMRFDDEILETESLTESQIAVGPPVDSDQPRRAGRVPQHGTKRFREDASQFSSPQLESATVTRPSTPAVGPAPKRLKITNGPAAKTKRS